MIYRFYLLLISAVMWGLPGCGPAASHQGEKEAQKIIFAISASQGSLQYQTAEEFTRRVNEQLPPGYQIVFYGSAQLGKDKDLMQKLKLGTVHLSLPSSIMSTYAPEFGLFEMPFLIRDRTHLQQIEQQIFWPEMAASMEPKGYKVIGLWENGFRHITNNQRPILHPTDLKGIKLRTPRSNWRVDMFRVWGGNPTPMAFSEVFVALQTGVIDGQENPLTNIYAEKLHEVQAYLSLSAHVYMPSYLTVGLRKWNTLPAEVQNILFHAAQEIKPWIYQTAERQEKELIDMLQEKGMKVNAIERDAFEEASETLYQSFGESVAAGQTWIQACKMTSAP
ncbi:MAG: TRAP transporter substrate-binding protein [Bacteroidota bacterium]